MSEGSTDYSANLSRPADIGTLDPGANSISGSVNAICALADPSVGCTLFDVVSDDGDAVGFTIPDGETLTAATLVIDSLAADSNGAPGVRGRSFADLGATRTGSDGTSDVLGGAPLSGAQTYQVSPELGEGAVAGDTMSFDWRLDLTVSDNNAVVPLPAGLPLLMTGLGACALLRRRARSGARAA